MSGEVIARLERALADVDAALYRVAQENFAGWLTDRVKEWSVHRAALSRDLLVAELGADRALRNAGVQVVTASHEHEPKGAASSWVAEAADAELGITSALGIAAETGTMLLPPHEVEERAVSLLPVRHLCVLREGQVVEDVAALFRLWGERGPVRGNAVLVTGPSRTADIEKELVLGVHGPQAVDVVLVAPQED